MICDKTVRCFCCCYCLSVLPQQDNKASLITVTITLEEDELDIVSVLQTIIEKDENKNSTNNSSNNKTPYKQAIHFLICDSCYWCASCIKLDVSVARCPSCNDNKVEWMPIMKTKFTNLIMILRTCGVVLEFSKSQERIR